MYRDPPPSSGMFFTLREIVKWLGLTSFEILAHLLCALAASVLAALKHAGLLPGATWWHALAPLYVCDGVNAYFAAIVLVRAYVEQEAPRGAAFRTAWSLTVIALLFVFKLLACQRAEDAAPLSHAEVMSPLFILLTMIMIRACQVH
ncbi:PREDICTED: transmembrane protein 203-like [Priapulus caudatus]|uniref:Transmembrane protein 203-like n=1 Tax=Priapulus caudatus TaxID=37621 RepID=A0ABM1EZD4_PRICU|nr:PREDICTED: transmembrane protein 203-like [Priapulus caudatus]